MSYKLYKMSFFLLFSILALCISQLTHASQFTPLATYTVCFTPEQDCTAKIVDSLDHAKRSIWVQAYSFTSRPIGKALLAAKRRGVEVNVIIDKSQVNAKRYSAARFFLHGNIPLWIDSQVNIAHNKVMIIDHNTVITGSFNFTYAAQYKNAENVLIIHDTGLAQHYEKNFLKRKQASERYEE